MRFLTFYSVIQMISEKFAIILAGGEGHRAGSDLPKQFVDVCGRPLVWWSMKAFHDFDPGINILLVVHPGFFDDWDIIFSELPEKERIRHQVICGGRTRQESVMNGLIGVKDFLAENDKTGKFAKLGVTVAIHDAARPNLKPEMINRGFSALEAGCGLVPAVRCTNSLRKLDSDTENLEDALSHSVERKEFVEVQTPQIFYYDEIMAANAKVSDKGDYTDDASIAEAAGMSIKLYEGEPDNIKVTHPLDFTVAGILLGK